MVRPSSRLLAFAGVLRWALALPQAGTSTATAVTTLSASATETVSTSVPMPSLPLSDTIPSEAPLPPVQAWCPSEVFCAGQLLQAVSLSQLYGDAKAFVDKPTVKTENATLADFTSIFNGSTTIGDIENFVTSDFKGEGLELEAVSENPVVPAFLADNNTLPTPLTYAWTAIVNGYWGNLIRQTDQSTLCPDNPSGCESTLIPLNHTLVVPGGRFREQYYWDSFWILEGLLTSELYSVAKETLLNFMDELELYGFIPNGGRIYYLNRSQPPVFIHMVARYVEVTGDTSILDRALQMAEVELSWWQQKRTISVTSPYTNTTYSVAHYAAVNTAPRPESYVVDYLIANGPDLPVSYTDQQKADIYAEIASAAETGWDFSSRWTTDTFGTVSNISNTNPLLRNLNVRALVPVDLNSILYFSHKTVADLYEEYGLGDDSTISAHRDEAANRKAAILDLCWDSERLAFYDFNTTSNSRTDLLTAAHYYPMWNGIWPDEVLNDETKAQALFSSLGLVLSQYNGTFPPTFITSGVQWDAPNTWPPHQYIIMKALANVPSNISTTPYPTLSSDTTSYSLIPSNQLGVPQNFLPVQNFDSGANATGDINYTGGTAVWSNAGAGNSSETWSQSMNRALANRYYSSAFCSWYSTGGSIPGLLNQLSPAELNASFSTPANTGNMYEKFNLLNIDTAGSGGEYTVQAGFGWTNGVLLWVASTYGPLIASPSCPAIVINSAAAPAAKRSIHYRAERVMRNGRYVIERSREAATKLMYGRQ